MKVRLNSYCLKLIVKKENKYNLVLFDVEFLFLVLFKVLEILYFFGYVWFYVRFYNFFGIYNCYRKFYKFYDRKYSYLMYSVFFSIINEEFKDGEWVDFWYGVMMVEIWIIGLYFLLVKYFE